MTDHAALIRSADLASLLDQIRALPDGLEKQFVELLDVLRCSHREIERCEDERDSWRKENEGTQETLDEASALLESVEVWGNGSTTFPGELLADIRLFLGPQRCSACKASAGCSVHDEEKET